MNSPKQTKATHLFCAMGEIRDVYIEEALTGGSSRSKNPRTRTLLLVACIAFSLVLVLSVGIILSRSKMDATSKENGNVMCTDGTQADLVQMLLESREKFDRGESDGVSLLSSAEEFHFFSGTAHVVWQYADRETLYVSRALTDAELETLTSEIGSGTPVTETAPTLGAHIWIVLKNGDVISPYLTPSDENTASARFFDYQTELIPSERFYSCMFNLIH